MCSIIIVLIKRQKDDKETKPSLPPRIPLKWPLTRAERCEELDKLASLYNNEQKANILAAKAYHQKFPPEELVPNEKVSFCHGQKIDRSPARLEEGPIWTEATNTLSPLRHAFHGH